MILAADVSPQHRQEAWRKEYPARPAISVSPSRNREDHYQRRGSVGLLRQKRIKPEKCSLTAKDAKDAKQDVLIPGVQESPHPSSSEDFGPWSEPETSDSGFLCDLGDLRGEISGLSAILFT